MASEPIPMADWPAAMISLDDTLRRVSQRLVSVEADLRMARTCCEALTDASRSCWRPSPSPAARLTLQELRVANLVATGMSNRDVAEALHVSVHTVKTHVKNLLDKLSIRSRWQVGAAVDQLSLAGTSAIEFPRHQIDNPPAGDTVGRQSQARSRRSQV